MENVDFCRARCILTKKREKNLTSNIQVRTNAVLAKVMYIDEFVSDRVRSFDYFICLHIYRHSAVVVCLNLRSMLWSQFSAIFANFRRKNWRFS
jgi:hypothetical protein